MMTQKDKTVLAELIQLGYDFNVIALTTMKGNPELEAKFEEMTARVMNSMNVWLATDGSDLPEETGRQNKLRFYMTLGIGAAWMWENRKEDVDSKGLYEVMAEPRTEYEMDEYIEDVVGIGFDRNSLEHGRLLDYLAMCYPVIMSNYNLDNNDEELAAGEVLMTYGMYYGYTRIYHERTIEPYKGTMPWHYEVWEALRGTAEGEYRLADFNEHAIKCVREGKRGQGNYVFMKSKDSEFGKTQQYYCQCTLNEKAGMRTIEFIKDDKINILTATPIFDTTRNYHLIIDKIHVWESGAEATITAHFSDDADNVITFYDTDYLENKDKYFVGVGYMFDLYGIAYQANLVPEDQLSLSFEGDKAVSFNDKLGKETALDDNGNPEPVNFDLRNLHTFMQTNDELPEDATFRSPVKAVYDDIDFFGKKIYDVEIGMPFHNDEHEKKHPLSVYIAAGREGNMDEGPVRGASIHGVAYLQGRMRCMTNWAERPSTVLHSFDALKKDGSKNVFNHVCPEEEIGQEMDGDEREEFAKEVFSQQWAERVSLSKYMEEFTGRPHFLSTRNRCFWIKADPAYNAAERFCTEDVTAGMAEYFRRRRFPVMAYITLYDTNGKESKWTKGGSYTAKFHYGSMLPGQKMEVMPPYGHDKLVELLWQTYNELDSRVIEPYLHKDLDFRSANLAEPMISREEYLLRTESVHRVNRKAKEGPVKAKLVQEDGGELHIELYYPDGTVYSAFITTSNGFITKIRIEKVKE